MASTLEQELLEYFAAAAGEQSGAAQVSDLPVMPTPSSTQAAAASKTATTTTTTSGGNASSTAATVLKSGFGLLPLIGALIGLFGGSDSSAPEPLVKYAMPAPIDIESAATESGWSSVDYDQMGAPRAYGAAIRPSTSSSSGAGGGAAAEGQHSGAPQITVNVQAMDARSFLDRSGDIAAAVRNAMLNLNSINDVVNDL